jgi:hypothetical protein
MTLFLKLPYRTDITTDGQWASLSWNKHPSRAYDHIFITVRPLRVCWYGALSLTRGRVCRLQLLLVLASAVIFGSFSSGTRDHILLSQIRDFVASYDSQDYGGGTRPRLQLSSLQLRCKDRVENTVSNSTSIIAFVSVAAGTCLPNSYLETNVVSEPFASNGCFSGLRIVGFLSFGTWRPAVR